MAAQRPRITLDLENRLFSDRRSALLRPITFIKSFAAISYQLISDRRIGIPRNGHAEKGEQKRQPTRESTSVLRPKLCSQQRPHYRPQSITHVEKVRTARSNGVSLATPA